MDQNTELEGSVSVLTLEKLMEAWEKSKRLAISPREQIKAIYIWEGSHDPTHPDYWRNRSGLKQFFEQTGYAPNQTGTRINAGALNEIPLFVSLFLLPGKIMLQHGDNTVSFCDEPGYLVKDGEK